MQKNSINISNKLRRSLRLQNKNFEINRRKCSALGLFDKLPLEIIYRIFYVTPVEELGLMSLTSKSMRNLIENFVNSKQGLKMLAPSCVIAAKTSGNKIIILREQFTHLGIFMKRATCLYPTKERLKKIDDFVSKLKCNVNDCQCLKKCASLSYYGKFIHTVISGWDNIEYIRVFQAIEKKSKVMKYIDLALCSQIGSRKHLELIIRAFYRSIFLDECENVQQKSFWLSTILKSFPAHHQARLYLILYAPLLSDEIQWTEINEHVISNLTEAKLYFKDLAVGIFMLHHFNNDWKDDDIINLLSEMTSIPTEWLPENVSTLLYLCGKEVTILYLQDIVNKGNFDEAASYITSLSLVNIKCEGEHLFTINIITKICEQIVEKRDKISYWNAIADSYHNAITCAYDLTEIGNQIGQDDSEEAMMKILNSFTELFKYSLNYWNFNSEE